MKISLFILMFTSIAFAGSSYEYIGRGRVVSVLKRSTALTLKVDRVLAARGSASFGSHDYAELRPTETYLAEFKNKLDPVPGSGDLIYFKCAWSCGKAGCGQKSWTLISEAEATADGVAR